MNIVYTVFPNGHICKYDLVKKERHTLWGFNKWGEFIYCWYNICKK